MKTCDQWVWGKLFTVGVEKNGRNKNYFQYSTFLIDNLGDFKLAIKLLFPFLRA